MSEKRIDLRDGGRLVLRDGDEEMHIEVVSWRGVSTNLVLAPDEIHELTLHLCTDPHTGRVMQLVEAAS